MKDFVIVVLFIGQQVVEFQGDGLAQLYDGKLIFRGPLENNRFDILRWLHLLHHLTKSWLGHQTEKN